MAVLALAAAVAMAAAAGKLVRYTAPGGHDYKAFETGLGEMLGRNGWQFSARTAPEQSGEPYVRLTYTRPGCGAALTIGIVGPTDGLLPYLTAQFGPRLAFVQNGQVVGRPDIARYQVELARQLARQLRGGTAGKPMPIIAVVQPELPATATGRDCPVPTAGAWAGLYRTLPDGEIYPAFSVTR